MHYSATERARLVGECVSSGMAVKTWCRDNGVASSTMYEWIRREREGWDGEGSPSFVEVSVAAPAPAAPAAGIV